MHTGVPDTTTVGLNADLDEAFALLLADWLNPQDRGVSVGANHGDRIARLQD